MTNEDLYSYVPDPLWERFKKGDQDAFARIYNEHIDNLLLYGMKTIRKEQVVKDAIQDLFVELWRSRENLQSVRSVPLYLFKSLRYKLFRESKMRVEVSTASISAYPSLPDSSIEMIILQREEECFHREKIGHAIRKLPCRQQEAINLRFYQGFSNEQIALIMDINYQSVINLIHKAILQLRKHLEYMLTLLIWVISIV
ncbi:MAG TPA: RNA polymerase sigma factor [Puia sp.]|jgi:RNA polymerase sigma-70 factor (ECF subfamily)|nr:RNA polymerase sigma factor [Puia sp.]